MLPPTLHPAPHHDCGVGPDEYFPFVCFRTTPWGCAVISPASGDHADLPALQHSHRSVPVATHRHWRRIEDTHTADSGRCTDRTHVDARPPEGAAGLSKRRVADRTLGSERVHAGDEPTMSVEHCSDAAAGGITLGVAARHRPVDVDDDRPIADLVFDAHRFMFVCAGKGAQDRKSPWLINNGGSTRRPVPRMADRQRGESAAARRHDVAEGMVTTTVPVEP